MLAQAAPPPPPRSLLWRDRGFFDTEALARLNRARVFWLTRLPTGITLRTARSAPRQEWADQLAAQSGDQVDARVWLGDGAFSCRLIARRCPAALAEKRKRTLRQTAKRKGRTVRQRQLVLCEWFVLVTNLPAKWLTPDEAFVLYRVRWQIELVFKCHKSDGGLAHSQARRGAPRLVELWAKWLARVLEHGVLLQHGGPLSAQSWRRRARRLRQLVPQLALSTQRSAARLRTTMHTILATLARIPHKPPRRKHPGTRELLLNPHLLLALS